MAETTTTNAPVDFRTDPAGYKHWKLTFDGPVATLAMDVREDGGVQPGYELKLNSYDLGVDIELYDAIQRLRFEHPEVGAVILTSAKERVFCAGGGYELALACRHIVMADDGNTSVALPEVPLLAVLPGTGGLTRLTDKRKVRRDRADYFCTLEEGVKGKRAVEWNLVDEVVPRTKLDETTKRRASELAAKTDRPAGALGVAL